MNTRRELLKAIGLGATVMGFDELSRAAMPKALSAAQTNGKPFDRAQGKPNIVVIVADDLGWNDVGFHGSEISTPNIDRLARGGVQLDRFYACPICSPTRAGLMTGRWPIRFGIMRAVIPPWRKYGLPDDEETIPQMLSRAGYKRRGCFGKWHLGHCHVKYHPLNRGFTDYYGCYNGAIDYFTHQREGQLDWHRGNEPAREEGYTTNLITTEAVRFINKSPAGEPFFAYVPYNAPHSPLQAPQKYLDKYPKLARRRKAFAAMVTCMDDGIGRILDALDKKGLADNTFVLFFSDNGGGPGADNNPLRGGKQTVFEGGVRVAAAVRWPAGGLKGGRKVSAPMGYIDVLPTLMRITAQKTHKGKPLDGLDVYDAMLAKSQPPKRLWFSYWAQSGPEERLAVMSDEWKLVRIGPGILKSSKARVHLFRINEDPNETTDLSAKHPKVVAELLAELKKFRSWRSEKGLPEYGAGRAGFTAPKDWTMPGT